MAHKPRQQNQESLAEVHSIRPGLDNEIYQGKEKIGDTTVSCKLHIPSEISDPVPLAIAPGYLGDQWAYQGVADYVASQGKPVLTWKFPRRQGVRGLINPSHNLYPQKLACQALYGSIRHIKNSDELPSAIDTSQVDAVGHSRGGPTIVRAAMKKPELFRTMVFDSPAGFEDHNTWMMAQRLIPFFQKEAIPTMLRRESHASAHTALVGLASYVLANPLRTAMEAIDVSKEDVSEMLTHSNIKDIPKAIYGYEADALIDIKKSIAKSGKLLHLSRIHPDASIGHLGPQRRPKEVGQAYLQMISELVLDSPGKEQPLKMAA